MSSISCVVWLLLSIDVFCTILIKWLMHNSGSAKESLSKILIFSGMTWDAKMDGADSCERLTLSSTVLSNRYFCNHGNIIDLCYQT